METGRLSVLIPLMNISEFSHTPVHIIGKCDTVAPDELRKPLKTVGLRGYGVLHRDSTGILGKNPENLRFK